MSKQPQTGLIRALGLGALIIYGVGDILGAGIYALVGKIAEHAGHYVWLSFAIAMGIVFLTALTYSELGNRFPKSGGVALYTHEAFNNQWFSILAGVLLFFATILSMSTLTRAFVGYLSSFGWNIPIWLGIFGFLLILMLINLRGIKQSSFTNILSTAVEVSGLLIVLVCGTLYLLHKPAPILPSSVEQIPALSDVFQGVALAFFAFTGFEDLANIAEEVKNPEKNIPRGILSAIATAGLFYMSVSWIATAVISPNELSVSDTPLLEVVKKSYPLIPHALFSVICIFAVANTTLLNYITASRLVYGMSEEKLLPKFFQRVHPRFHTPYVPILLIFPLVFGLGLSSNLKDLASSTSAVVLVIFSLSSVSLIKIKLDKRKNNAVQANQFRIPLFVPFLAVGLNLMAIWFLPLYIILLAAMFIGVAFVITWIICNSVKYI